MSIYNWIKQQMKDNSTRRKNLENYLFSIKINIIYCQLWQYGAYWSVDDHVVDKFCSKASSNKEKTKPTPSSSAQPPTSKRSGSFVHYSIRFKVLCEPDWTLQ